MAPSMQAPLVGHIASNFSAKKVGRQTEVALDSSEGMLSCYDPDTVEEQHLRVSLECASQLLSRGRRGDGTYAIPRFDLHEVIATRGIRPTLPATIEGIPVTAAFDSRFGLEETFQGTVIKAKPIKAPLALLALPDTLVQLGRGLISRLLPTITHVSSSVTNIDLSGLAGSITHLCSSASIGLSKLGIQSQIFVNNAKRQDEIDVSSCHGGADINGVLISSESPVAKSNPAFEDPRKRFGISRPMGDVASGGLMLDGMFGGIPRGLSFGVGEGNPVYCSIDGSLFSRSKKELRFLSLPYPQVIILPDGVERISPEAYAYGVGGPDAIVVPSSMRTAVFAPGSTTLWICGPGSEFERYARSQGWTTASRDFVRGGQFDYNPLPDGTIRIVRCKGNPKIISVPQSIDGKTVTPIGNKACSKAACSITLPDTVAGVLESTVCPNLTTITLPERLRYLGPASFRSCRLNHPLVIPKTTDFIGTGSLDCGIETFEANGATVLMDPPFTQVRFTKEIPPFNFARYAKGVVEFPNQGLKLQAILVRLCSLAGLSPKIRRKFTPVLLDHLDDVTISLCHTGDLNALHLLLESDTLTEPLVEQMTQQLTRYNQTECVMELIEYRHHVFGDKHKSVSSRFAL